MLRVMDFYLKISILKIEIFKIEVNMQDRGNNIRKVLSCKHSQKVEIGTTKIMLQTH